MASREAPPRPPRKSDANGAAAKRMAENRKRKKIEEAEGARRIKALARFQLARFGTDGIKIQKTLQELLEPERENAVKVIVSIMKRSRNEELRAKLAMAVIERLDGAVPKAISLGGTEGKPIRVQHEVGPPSLLTLLGPTAEDVLRNAGRIIDVAEEENDGSGSTEG